MNTSRRLVRALSLVAGTCAFSTLVRAEQSAATEALLEDLERIIAAESSSWFLDAQKHTEILPDVLDSVCRVGPETRQAALGVLEQRLRRAGTPEILYERDGERSSAVDRALEVQRQLDALTVASERAALDCPFWVEVDPEFSGRQTNRDKLTLNLETGGILQLRQTEGRWTYGGGGYGRFLLGQGFGGHLTLLGGAELGGGAMLRPGTRPTEFLVNFFPALPVVFRVREVSWHYEIEAAAVGLFQAEDISLSYGARIGAGIGLSALRVRNLIPWAGLAIAYEQYFPSGGRERAHFIRGGLRVGFPWDPG